MTRRRFYASPASFATSRVTLDREEAHHLRDVLRLNVGDEVFVFDGAGREFRCRIERVARRTKGCAAGETILEVCEEVGAPHAESPFRLTLTVALLKNEKFDWVVQKATELGVSAIVPVETRRADVRLERGKNGLKNDKEILPRVARWQRLALEAAKQSGRAFVPTVHVPRPFVDVIESGAGVLFSERDGENLRDALSRLNVMRSDETQTTRETELTALVGSEGGWTDEELTRARDAGWRIVTLGGRTLRAETAAITVAALLQHLCGDLV